MSAPSDEPGDGERASARLTAALVSVALVVAVVSSLGAPLITTVATTLGVSLDAAQWTLTVTLFSGSIAGPVLGRLGSGPLRRVTVLGCLSIVVVGGVLTVLPLPFPFLLLGRALQGVGLGTVPLLMSVARAHLPAPRSGSTIATLSVTSTVGIGVGYPLIGLVDQVAGLRASYAVGLVLSVVALLIAWRALPRELPGERPRIDAWGALLLGAGTLGVLVVIAVPSVWTPPWIGAVILVATVLALTVWTVHELRAAAPLVDLRLLSLPSVLRANAAMLVVGAGIYLLFSLFTRYLQTPAGADYGFALPGVVAGAALIPFSALGFVAGRMSPGLVARLTLRWTFAAAAASIVLAALVFALANGSFVAVLIAMALLGYGLGAVSAVMPRLLLTDAPHAETASVLAINQIMRSVGFSLGSALAGLLLAHATPAGALLPAQEGYVIAAFFALPLVLFGTLVVVLRRRSDAAGFTPPAR